ncbi:hypothetical protein [Halogranum rubrum]|uniref:Uncharacterized protein n=1 Tax=Halogranum salarium B-1 TaxID=1210908 RepID=J3EUM1_9EURY|nr:hypothetical protein [Halogranum salarium]EJN58112.1 hypothetical protein HSB1_35290 [Halogranum salarium B-1]
MFDDTNDWRSVVTEAQALNRRRLKYVGIATYFGVYALIALGLRRSLNTLLQSLPLAIRPGPLVPIDALLGLPTSVAWGLTSLCAAILAVATVAGYSVAQSLSTPDEGSTTTDAETDVDADTETD